MIYATCHFTKAELELIERCIFHWRATECPTGAGAPEHSHSAAVSVARELANDLIDRCVWYREAMHRRQEREHREDDNDPNF